MGGSRVATTLDDTKANSADRMTDFDKFDAAMGTILKADPKAVKAAMEADKQGRSAVRQAKRAAAGKE